MRNFFAVLASVMALFSTTTSAQALTYGTYFKGSHNIIKAAVEPYFDEISNNTGNSLSFRFLTDGTVVGASTTTKGVQQGLVMMGTVIPIYSSNLPISRLISNLPMFQVDSLIETAVVNELFFLHCDECQPEWKAANITPLALYGTSPYYLQCTSEMHSMADLVGKRIQGTGEYGALATTLGGLPLGLTATEFYTGMSQGALDCVLGATSWLDTYGLKDVVKQVIDVPLGVFRPISLMNMNTKRWNRLSDEQRAAFINGLPKLVADAAYGYVAEDQAARQNGLDAHIKFSEPFDGFVAAFNRVSEEGGERFIALAKNNGMQNPENLLARYLELETEWRAIVENLNSPEEYEQALRERVFTKVKWD